MVTVEITKLVHACLVVRSGGGTVLIDPGAYTWNDERFDVSTLPELDRILVTHGHPDHLSVEFARELHIRFPRAAIETTEDVKDMLANHGIASTTGSTDIATRFDAPHEMTPVGTAPPNVGFHVAGMVSHPGDSHTFSSSMPVLAIAFLPPWGSMTGAVEQARRVGPRYVLPIHDWHLSDNGKQFVNQVAAMSFQDDDITHVPLNDFEAVTLELD